MKFALKSKNVLTAAGLRDAIVLIEDGVIRDVLDYNSYVDCEIMDYGELVIMPGLADTHVHINEPGRTEWEGFETATKSAAAGGITMLVDMPLNCSPVTTTVFSLHKKLEAAKNKLYVDCGFYGGVIPDNINELKGMIENGVLGLKAFLIHSGLDDFPNVTEEDLRKTLQAITSEQLQNVPLLVHSELQSDISHSENYNECSFKSFLSERPGEWENKAIELLIKLCREYDYPVHIVHLSCSGAIDMIKKAKSEGLKISVETCPHYLFFSAEEIIETCDRDTRFKCTPPIRENENREELWNALKEGVIDFIVSDHSPCDQGLKCLEEGSFEKAWGGISGLQLGLSAVWTEARKRGFSITDVSGWMSTKPASFTGLGNKKGKIEKGFDADFAVFNPDQKFIVDEKKIFHKHKITPYSGRELYGVVKATYLRGKKIFENGKIVAEPTGKVTFRHKVSKTRR